MKKTYIVPAALACFLLGITVFMQPASTEPAAKRIEVVAHRFAFSPAEITLKNGEAVVLVLKSSDVSHGLRIHELNIDAKIPKGGTTEVRLTPKETGNFVGHCSVFCGSGHGEMTFAIHVVE
jgi:cytochrome c oxidase subunit 2